MAVINGCRIPEDLYYDVPMEVWVRFEAGGTATLGMTDPASTRAGRLLRLTVKRPGKFLERGATAAIAESAKWLGPFPTPLTGEVVEGNARVMEDANLVNRDLYGEGWIVRIRPTRLPEERPLLLTGAAAVQAYREVIEREGLLCIRCADPADPLDPGQAPATA